MSKKAYLCCRDLDACKQIALMFTLFGTFKALDKNPGKFSIEVQKSEGVSG